MKSWIILLLLVGTTVTRAAALRIEGTLTVASGQSSGGPYSVAGIVPFGAAGNASGSVYSLTTESGNPVASVQSVAAPWLTAKAIPGGLQLSWPTAAGKFVLEQTDALDAPAWQVVQTPAQEDGSTLSVSLPLPAGNWYFRLRQLQ